MATPVVVAAETAVPAVSARTTAPAVSAGETTVPRVDRKPAGAETLSSSGAFLVRGSERSDRSVVVAAAEELREEVSRFLDRQERRGEGAEAGEPVPREPGRSIVIHLWLRGDAQPAVHPRLYRVDGVPQPVLGVVLARAALVRSDDFRREMIRVLLVERMIRMAPGEAAPSRGEMLPAWLETGVMEALDHVRAGRPSARFATLFGSRQILTVDDILTVQPATLDAGAREIFASSACCLVMALLEQPEGPERFRRFLEAAPGREGSWQNLLVRTFPGLALSRHSLEKWWALQAASLAAPDLLEPMSAADTDALLAQALIVRYRPGGSATAPSPVGQWLRNWIPGRSASVKPAPVAATAPAAGAPADPPPANPPPAEEEMIPHTELARIASLPRRAEILKANQAALSTLLLRAFPLHRPIIQEYQRILGRLSLGKIKGLAGSCDELAARRTEVLAIAENTTDLLNWYEATQRDQLSGTFERYFEMLDHPKPRPTSPVVDPIARTLDELEVEFATP